MKISQPLVFIAATLLSGCNHGDHKTSVTQQPSIPLQPTKPVQPTQPGTNDKAQVTELTVDQVKSIAIDRVTFDAPGVSALTVANVTNIKANFGHAYIDQASGEMVFELTSSSKLNKSDQQAKAMIDSPEDRNVSSSGSKSSVIHSRLASEQNYHFKINYQVGDKQYQVLGYALPLYQKDKNTIVPRFNKLDAAGDALAADLQVLTRDKSDWSCVTDASSDLTWQVLQANGDFAFDSTYYWGDRTLNHRDYMPASCALDKDCNTDNLVEIANAQKLCGKTDWRMPTRNEWKTILTTEMLNDEKRQSPIDRFFFPYLDANYDEAYWTNHFTVYLNGHEGPDGDWQGSNKTVGDALVMWMGSDFAYEKMSPRSTNEPRFAMLVSGAVIPDESDNSTGEITAQLKSEINKAGDEDKNWKKRFIKNGKAGQALRDQDLEQWACTSDSFFKSVVPNTNILWQRIDKKAPLMTLEQAQAYAKTVNTQTLCGRNDWRLPSESELKSLLIDSLAYGMEDMSYRAGYTKSIFNDTVVGFDSYYWTATEYYADPKNKNVAVAFQNEWSESSGKLYSERFRVRLISTSVKQK